MPGYDPEGRANESTGVDGQSKRPDPIIRLGFSSPSTYMIVQRYEKAVAVGQLRLDNNT